MTLSSSLLTITCKTGNNLFLLHWGQREEERGSAHRENCVGSFLWGIKKDYFRINFDQTPSCNLQGLKNNNLPGFTSRKNFAVSCILKLDSLLWLFVILVNPYFAGNKPVVFLTVWPCPLPPFDPVESSLLNQWNIWGNYHFFWHSVDPANHLGFSAKP